MPRADVKINYLNGQVYAYMTKAISFMLGRVPSFLLPDSVNPLYDRIVV